MIIMGSSVATTLADAIDFLIRCSDQDLQAVQMHGYYRKGSPGPFAEPDVNEYRAKLVELRDSLEGRTK